MMTKARISSLSMEEFWQISGSGGLPIGQHLDIDEQGAYGVVRRYRQYVFWEYAVKSVFEHATEAEVGGINQGHVPRAFHWDRRNAFDAWRFFDDCFRRLSYGDIQGSRTTLLHIASERGLLTCVKERLDGGVDVNVDGGRFRFGVVAAATEGHDATVDLLLQRGADKEVRDKRGRTALCRAAEEGHRETARFLLAEGADITAKNKDGATVLHKAAGERLQEDGKATGGGRGVRDCKR
jgi:hypothetical protein